MFDFTDAIHRESSRLQSSPPAELEPQGMGTIRFVGHTPDSSKVVIEKAKAVLQLVNEQSYGEWPHDNKWIYILPDWFVGECGPELTANEAEEEMARRRTLSPEEKAEAVWLARWSVSAWTYWLQPEHRLWFWWDAVELTEHDFVVAVETHEWPFPSGAFLWLLRACGADKVEPEI